VRLRGEADLSGLTTVTGLRSRRGGRTGLVRGTRDLRKPASGHGISAKPCPAAAGTPPPRGELKIRNDPAVCGSGVCTIRILGGHHPGRCEHLRLSSRGFLPAGALRSSRSARPSRMSVVGPRQGQPCEPAGRHIRAESLRDDCWRPAGPDLPAGGRETDPMAITERDRTRWSTHRHTAPNADRRFGEMAGRSLRAEADQRVLKHLHRAGWCGFSY
jgi:hypothetical protein